MRRNGTGKQRQRTVSATSQVYASVSKIKENDIATSHCARHHDHCDSYFTFLHTHIQCTLRGRGTYDFGFAMFGGFLFFPMCIFLFRFRWKVFWFYLLPSGSSSEGHNEPSNDHQLSNKLILATGERRIRKFVQGNRKKSVEKNRRGKANLEKPFDI